MWHMGNSLAGQWLGLGAFTTVAWVQSLVRELISYKSWGMVDKRKKRKVTCGRYILRSCLFPPSNLIESLVGYEILAWKLFSLRTSKALFHYLLTSGIATKESDTILVLHVISSLSLCLSERLFFIPRTLQYHWYLSILLLWVICIHCAGPLWSLFNLKTSFRKVFLYNFFDNSLVCFICSIFQKFDFLNWFSKFLFSLFVLFFWKS